MADRVFIAFEICDKWDASLPQYSVEPRNNNNIQSAIILFTFIQLTNSNDTAEVHRFLFDSESEGFEGEMVEDDVIIPDLREKD